MSEDADHADTVNRLESRLQDATDDWQEAVESGDEKGAAYALGKESAFITAIEVLGEGGEGSE